MGVTEEIDAEAPSRRRGAEEFNPIRVGEGPDTTTCSIYAMFGCPLSYLKRRTGQDVARSYPFLPHLLSVYSLIIRSVALK